jgi:MFS family permease
VISSEGSGDSVAQMAAALPPLRKNRDFMLLWSGQVVSTVGSEVSALAFPLLVLATTQSPTRAGIVGFAQTLPNLFLYLPAGALVDRWDRKRIMLIADAVRAIALASVALALATGRLSFAHVVAVALLEGSLSVFFRLAESAALPQVVPKQQLPDAIAQNQARQQGAGVISQPLAGFLFSIGRVVPFAFDAVSYAVSFVSLLLIRPVFQEERERPPTRLRVEIAEGIAWLARERFLRTTILLSAGTNFAHAALGLVLIVRAQGLGASPTLIGFLFGLFAGGAVLGSLAAPWLQRHVAPPVILIGSIWLWAVGTAVLVLVANPLVLGALAGVQAFVGPPWNVVVGSYRYALVPDRLLGRVQSAGALVSWGTIPLGALAAGFLLEALGARPTFLVLAGIFVVVAVGATSARTIRQAPPLTRSSRAADESRKWRASQRLKSR